MYPAACDLPKPAFPRPVYLGQDNCPKPPIPLHHCHGDRILERWRPGPISCRLHNSLNRHRFKDKIMQPFKVLQRPSQGRAAL
ncbi:hypothetical protein ELH77_14875 [Rhizobium ruizarguesonis]|nr:hypothetical protein ELI53_14365 [Rhizobium ruizarguesonis]TAZ19946.1 hypothetical protein ELH77_14875 [Rhizobium ruizarguesonis]